jgi:hypothetical protein
MIKRILNFARTKGLVIASLLAITSIISVASAPAVSAMNPVDPSTHTFAATCTDIKTYKDKKDSVDGNACIYQKYINPLIKFMSAIAGLAGVISIVVGGIQYSLAGGDMGKVAAAKKRITQAVFAFLAFIFLLAFLQWIVPGGLNGRG